MQYTHGHASTHPIKHLHTIKTKETEIDTHTSHTQSHTQCSTCTQEIDSLHIFTSGLGTGRDSVKPQQPIIQQSIQATHTQSSHTQSLSKYNTHTVTHHSQMHNIHTITQTVKHIVMHHSQMQYSHTAKHTVTHTDSQATHTRESSHTKSDTHRMERLHTRTEIDRGTNRKQIHERPK